MEIARTDAAPDVCDIRGNSMLFKHGEVQAQHHGLVRSFDAETADQLIFINNMNTRMKLYVLCGSMETGVLFFGADASRMGASRRGQAMLINWNAIPLFARPWVNDPGKPGVFCSIASSKGRSGPASTTFPSALPLPGHAAHATDFCVREPSPCTT